jgi:hypothetical protein
LEGHNDRQLGGDPLKQPCHPRNQQAQAKKDHQPRQPLSDTAVQGLLEVLVGGKTLLKLIGAIEGDSGEENVSNADLSEDIRELHSLLNGMSNRLDEGVKQIYQNRLTPSTTLSAPSTWSAPR